MGFELNHAAASPLLRIRRLTSHVIPPPRDFKTEVFLRERIMNPGDK
jgi:hypothetical protein